MKRITLALLAAAAFAVAHARADTRVSIGVNIGVPSYRAAPPIVAYAPPPAVCPPAPVVVAPARGYWKEVVVKTWVPERWVVRHDRWGRPVRYSEPGYYTYRTDRVWVDAPAYGPAGRGHAYGYSGRDGWKR